MIKMTRTPSEMAFWPTYPFGLFRLATFIYKKKYQKKKIRRLTPVPVLVALKSRNQQ